MKFTDGFWQLRPGVTALYAQEAYDIETTDTTADVHGRHGRRPRARGHGTDERHRQAW